MISIFLTLKIIVNHHTKGCKDSSDSRLPEGGTVTGTIFTGDTDLLCSLGLKKESRVSGCTSKGGRAGMGVGFVCRVEYLRAGRYR